jgi:replicative DNA helicase
MSSKEKDGEVMSNREDDFMAWFMGDDSEDSQEEEQVNLPINNPIEPPVQTPPPMPPQPQQQQNNTQPQQDGIGPYLPKQDNSYVETEQIAVQGQQPVTFQFTVPSKPVHQHEVEMWDIINKFETDSWSPTNTGLKSGWTSVDNAFDGGIKSGFIIIAGDSNIGKSGFMSQLSWQLVENNDDVYVMDFSLDDPMPDKLARVVGAGSKVLLNAVRNPNNYTNLPLMLARRKVAINKLRENVHKYRSYDANFTTFCEDIEEEIKRVKIMLETAGLKKRVVVMIDNMHDLNLKNKPSLTDKQKYDEIAQWCSDTAIRYDIPVICTAELKKLNGTRRPSLDDIREAVKIKYEAKAVLLVYNEVHYKGEAAEVYFLRKNTPLKQPIFEVHFAKNKFNNFKGRTFFEFYPEMARMEEVDQQSSKHYASLIFGS